MNTTEVAAIDELLTTWSDIRKFNVHFFRFVKGVGFPLLTSSCQYVTGEWPFIMFLPVIDGEVLNE